LNQILSEIFSTERFVLCAALDLFLFTREILLDNMTEETVFSNITNMTDKLYYEDFV